MPHRIGSPIRPAAMLVVLLAALCAALLVPSAGVAVVVKRLDFESGNLRQWRAVQAVPGGIRVVRSPVRQGRFAGRFYVTPGDDPIGASGERAELSALTGEREGVESWWSWSTRFGRRFTPTRGDWNIFTQWHPTGPTCMPNVSFHIFKRPYRPAWLALRVRGGAFNSADCTSSTNRRWALAPFRRARWISFKFHVRWSSNPNVGFVEVWVNGRKRVQRTPVATLYAGQGVYVKQGFYRVPSPRSHLVYHDGLRRFRP